MSKLNEIIAVNKTRKSEAKSRLTSAYQLLQKSDQFQGMVKTYRPKDEEGERLPSDTKLVQCSVSEVLNSVRPSWSNMFNVVLQQDLGNTVAVADIVVDGKVLMEKVPAVTLIFLEKQLVDLKTLIDAIPTLSPIHEWRHDETDNLYKTDPVESHRTKKVKQPIILAEATHEHPAQTELVTVDVVDGYWNTRYITSAIPTHQKKLFLDRLASLREAVIRARERANSVEIENRNEGHKILDFIFE